MILLKRRAFMTCKFNYETSKGIKQVILTNCAQAPFKQFSILGNSHQNSTTGKQLFDAKTIVRDMVIELDGSLVSEKEYFTSDFIKVDPSTTYFVNATGSKRGKYFDENKKVMFTSSFSDFNPENGAVITTPEKAYYIRFSGLIGNIETIMLNKGSSATPYEPYTGGKPAPSPDYLQEIKSVGKWNEKTQKYEVDVKVTGKNLFNKELAGNAPIISYKYIPIRVGKGAKVSVSYSKQLTTGLGFYVLISKDLGSSSNSYVWLYHSIASNLIKNKYTFTAVDDVISLSFAGDLNSTFENMFNDLQIEISDTPTEYEPYKEQTATITMDEPLRGIGKYQDKITKDGIARRIRSVMLNGNEDWELHGSNGNINNFGYILREAISNNVGQRSSLTFSSYKSGVWATDRLGQDMFARIIRINLPKDVFPDVETLRNWLSQSKTTLQYVLEKEVIVPISQSEQDAIRALTTYHPTTVITVDGGDVDAGIEVEYATKNKE